MCTIPSEVQEAGFADGVKLLKYSLTGRLARNKYERMCQEAAAVCMQKHLRMWAAQRKYLWTLKAAIVIQAGIHGMTARKEFCFRQQTKAATIVQV
jgi:myosin-5